MQNKIRVCQMGTPFYLENRGLYVSPQPSFSTMHQKCLSTLGVQESSLRVCPGTKNVLCYKVQNKCNLITSHTILSSYSPTTCLIISSISTSHNNFSNLAHLWKETLQN
uniref:Uncharacterized protein n=1 Tax=Sphaerodactylus townsendi TaxID=933632 RepID=A0ACB8F2C1_9SAUR